MHRAVLLAADGRIEAEQVMLQGAPAAAASAPQTDAAAEPRFFASQATGAEAAPASGAAHANAAAYGAYAHRQCDAAPADGMPETAGGHAATGLVGRTVAEVERDLILDTLEHTLGNRTHAANILGISIRTLRNKLRSYMDEGTQVPAPSANDRAHA
jgi:DNA-binding NtrC family response regulator